MFYRYAIHAAYRIIQAFARHLRVMMSVTVAAIGREAREAIRRAFLAQPNSVRETFKLALALPAACAICFAARAQPLPTGSYQDSCSNILVNRTTLQATCKTINQQDNNTALPNYASCAGDIGNANGVLTCKAAVSAGRSSGAVRPSIGTSTDLRSATEALLTGFSRVTGGGASHGAAGQAISIYDLRQVAEVRDSTFPRSLQDAAKFYLASPAVRSFVSSDAGKVKPDGLIRKPDLEDMLGILSAGHFEQALLGGISGNDGYAAVLREPGVPSDTRDGLLRRLSDAQLLQIVGRPNVQGDARDKAEGTAAFLALAKVSWLGAAEAEALARYQVPFTLDRGPRDKGFSFWNGQSIHLSEKMAKGGAPGYLSEVLAHEGGHALYQKSGLQDRAFKDVTDAKLTRDIDRIINEGFAGVFGNRAHVALFGHNDPNIDRNLVLLNDVSGSLVSDSTLYAARYHVDTAAARAQIDGIKRILSKDLVPYLQQNFNLLGDPQLSLGLASPVQ